MQGAGIGSGAPATADGDLFVRARGGDLASFEAIAVERLPRLYRLAHAILGDDTEAAEATSNTLIGAWHELPRLDDPARFDEWLDRILISECRMTLERAGRGEVPPGPSASLAATDELDRDEILRLLDGAFETLDAVDRAVLVLHDLEGRSPGAIAGTLHMPLGTVRWRLHEAHLVLRAALEVPA
jgi:RNA polymerase sigma-70 factor (ECF subfamily)